MANSERRFGALVPLQKAGGILGMSADEMGAAIHAGTIQTVQVGGVSYILGDTLEELVETPVEQVNARIREQANSRRLQPGEDMNSYIRGRGAR